MDTRTSSVQLGDVVLTELPFAQCRDELIIARILAATEELPVGQLLETIGAAVAAVQTLTLAAPCPLPDAGTYRLGYKGFWTTVLAYDANVAAINAALDVMVALSGGTAGDIIYSGGVLLQTTGIFTFLNTLGNVPLIRLDARELTDAGISCEDSQSIATTTAGALATEKVVVATAASCDAILCRKVALNELTDGVGNAMRRSCLTKPHAIVNSSQFTCVAAELVGAIAALVTIGLDVRTEPLQQNEGLPDGR